MQSALGILKHGVPYSLAAASIYNARMSRSFVLLVGWLSCNSFQVHSFLAFQLSAQAHGSPQIFRMALPRVQRATPQDNDVIGSSDEGSLKPWTAIETETANPQGRSTDIDGKKHVSHNRQEANGNGCRNNGSQRKARGMTPKANDGPIPSTIDEFSKSGTRWVEAEMKYYQEQSGYAPMLCNKKGIQPPIKHLELACEEFVRRFTVLNTEDPFFEEEYDESRYESPFLLIANNVKDDWNVPISFKNRYEARFMLVRGATKDSSTLFIKCLAGPIHGDLDGEIMDDIEDWIKSNGLRLVFIRSNSGGESYQPDKALRPGKPDRLDPRRDADDNRNGSPYPRLYIEIEHKSRIGRGLREIGVVALKNPYTRLFLGIKFWSKNKSGEFAAVAVLWGKDDEGRVTFRKALDFGTRPVGTLAQESFTIVNDDIMLPPVKEWSRPRPSPGYTSLLSELETLNSDQIQLTTPPDWCLTLPAKDLLYRVSRDLSTDDCPYVLDEARAIDDCQMNLKVYAWKATNNIQGL